MAASSDDQAPPSETLNPTVEHSLLTNDGHDSPVPPHQPPPEQSQPSNAPSTDADEAGEKRKRVDTEDHPMWKTSLCSYFRRSEGSCSHGDGCRYAHGEEELRPRPGNTWDPTSERAKKMLKSENGENSKAAEEGGGGGGDVMMMTDALDGDVLDGALAKCLVNLPMKWSSDNLRTFLSDQGIDYKSAKKKKGMLVGFVNFESAEQVKRAMEELDGTSVGNKILKVADVVPRSFEKNFTQQNMNSTSIAENDEVLASSNGCEDGDTIDNDVKPDCSNSKSRSARDVVTPLAYMPYADQLEHKKSNLLQILKKLTRNGRKACPNGVALPEWILKSREIGGLPCKLEGILESPIVNGYRNKCEFSVGNSLQGKPTVGFMLGNFREGVTAVEEPTDCPNVSRVACKYAAIFHEFLQHSDMPIWNRLNNTGFWRQLTVREGRNSGKGAEVKNSEVNISEVMLIVQVCTEGFDDALVNSEIERMARAFAVVASADSSLPRMVLVVQDHKGISNVAQFDAPLRSIPIPKSESHPEHETASDGEEARIHDYIGNLRFSISPTAFFQVNTLAAEKLYSLAGDWAGLGPDTLLFDICCGTGTIGLTLAHRVGMVVGIEMNGSAVSDAHRNAEINGIKNCRFVCAKAEDVMGSLLKEYLNLPKKQDEISCSSKINNDEPTSIEENDDSASLKLGSRNGKSTSGCPDNGSHGLDNQPHNSCPMENGSPMLQFKNVVAIVDPPRAGLHPTVIKALRTHPRLRRLVYISCNPESLVANAIELCTPSADKTEKGQKNNRGWRNMSSAGLARHRAKSMPNSEPFQPVKAMAVDLFPHTPHCELVMLLER
ncbi:zinc finger CCCH domain-containing protein 24 [Rhododendron vialii]|uniref:zinc finger CCCH domain-containing protein 24 n=1 Tax=Rhododendron vialii TaxID=182163 RepID=UPI00265F4215|nr:zinc finger CCCH domain-containing protein 24 [Rhododendron vialii]